MNPLPLLQIEQGNRLEGLCYQIWKIAEFIRCLPLIIESVDY